MSELFGIVTPLLILAMLPGLVQFIKELFSLEGKIVTTISMGLGIVLAVVLQLQVLFPGMAQWVSIAVYGVLFGMTASGYYKLATRND
jgi:hypothetical protein